MREDPGGGPMVGPSVRLLGVRPFRQDSATHGLIEPAARSLDNFQKALEATKPNWKKLPWILNGSRN